MNIIITQNQMCHSLPLLSSSSSSLSSTLSSKMSFVNKIKNYNGIIKYNQELDYILNNQRGGDIDDESDDDEESEYDLDDEGEEEEEEEDESEYDDEYDSDNEEEEEVTSAKASTSASVTSNTKSIIEYDEPLSLSPLTDMGITLGVMLLCNKLDLTNTKIIKMAR